MLFVFHCVEGASEGAASGVSQNKKGVLGDELKNDLSGRVSLLAKHCRNAKPVLANLAAGGLLHNVRLEKSIESCHVSGCDGLFGPENLYSTQSSFKMVDR